MPCIQRHIKTSLLLGGNGYGFRFWRWPRSSLSGQNFYFVAARTAGPSTWKFHPIKLTKNAVQINILKLVWIVIIISHAIIGFFIAVGNWYNYRDGRGGKMPTIYNHECLTLVTGFMRSSKWFSKSTNNLHIQTSLFLFAPNIMSLKRKL